jgi:hypothetical protein
MIRTFFLTTSVILSAAIIAPAASAHPEPAPAVKIDKKSVTKIEDIKLPTQAEIKQLQKNMPDMNAIMGQMMTVMKDPELREGMEKSGKTFAKKLEKSGAMEPTGPDGLPDFNKAFGAMLSLMGDEDAMGGMLESLGAMAEGLEGIEQHIPESAKAPKTD